MGNQACLYFFTACFFIDQVSVFLGSEDWVDDLSGFSIFSGSVSAGVVKEHFRWYLMYGKRRFTIIFLNILMKFFDLFLCQWKVGYLLPINPNFSCQIDRKETECLAMPTTPSMCFFPSTTSLYSSPTTWHPHGIFKDLWCQSLSFASWSCSCLPTHMDITHHGS